MCLETLWEPERLAKLQARAAKGPIRAWKIIVRSVDGSLRAQYGRIDPVTGRNFEFKQFYHLNKDKSRGTLHSTQNGKYRKGFHAYARKFDYDYDGGLYLFIPVLLWDIVAAGTQYRRHRKEVVYVARKMMLLC